VGQGKSDAVENCFLTLIVADLRWLKQGAVQVAYSPIFTVAVPLLDWLPPTGCAFFSSARRINMRTSRHVTGAMTAVVLAVALWVVPAHATVHEIVAQWCSGQDELDPPGISDPSKKNFARPLNATGVLQTTFIPELNIVLVSFDLDHPAVKIQSSGMLAPIGATDEGIPIFLDVPKPNPDFPAFRHCPRLAGL
jgi:hypothetical protein